MGNKIGYSQEDDDQDKRDKEIARSAGLPAQYGERAYGRAGERLHEEIRESFLNIWDQCLSDDEIYKIGKVDPEAKHQCPYLKRVEGSEYFYYCEQLVRFLKDIGIEMAEHPETEVDMESAEYHTKRNPNILETLCTGDNFEKCENYYDE
jgi:hypothetical protein